MGKKDGKRVDKVKVEAKKAKQAAKQTKLVKKSVKKEIKELGEDDIEMMIAEVSSSLFHDGSNITVPLVFLYPHTLRTLECFGWMLDLTHITMQNEAQNTPEKTIS